MAQVSMLSDEWLSRYGLLENFNIRIAIFEDVLDFNLQPHPWPGPRGPMPWNESLPYRVSMVQV